MRFKSVLGLGSAYGDEFLPIIDRIDSLIILEPSDNLVSKQIGNLSPIYRKPSINGSIPLSADSFDLVVSFSALHHIPNVSFVLSELERVLKPGGILLTREPIRTMGDWQKPRPGLTKNERGIPLQLFERFVKAKNLRIIKSSLCDCAFAVKIFKTILPIKKDSRAWKKFDSIIAKAFSWNLHYHPQNAFQKIAPASIFMVLSKSKGTIE